YGLDSIITMELINKLEEDLGQLPQTLFFEYENIEELTEYFLESHHEKMIEIVGLAGCDNVVHGQETEEVSWNEGIKQPISRDHLKEKVTYYLKEQISLYTKIPVSSIEEDVPMEAYGLDSIITMELINKLEEDLGQLPQTLFFEYENIEELTEYFLESHHEKMIEIV
ncbi:acyl carrier protein, partial [Bacillus cereus group sp. BfR-BA-01441]|uniref:acyl carrier protein n=1 Tax=Bacillus cereus group sp. BfR-BA-01441 TaxID=2920348 RepID=UPI001F5700FD